MGRHGLRSFVGIGKRQPPPEFIGREAQLVWFRDNLDGGGPGDRRRPVIGVSGPAGVGKTWLLRQWRDMARESGAVAAGSDRAEVCAVEAMCRLAGQFAAQDQPLEHFASGYLLYCQRRHEIEAEPQSATGPGLLESAVDGLVEAKPWDLPGYVAQRVHPRGGQRPLLKPVDVLTPLFLKDLARLAQWRLVVLFFDDYQYTGTFLDGWLRDLLEGRHGEMPANLLLVLASEHGLDREAWAAHETDLARQPLEPFTPDEARHYLALKGIVDDPLVELILDRSDRLPLLLATLAVAAPAELEAIGPDLDARDGDGLGAVACFLQWLADPRQRQIVLDAALPRRLTPEVIALLAGQEEARALLEWLQSLPFVERRGQGWVYHDLVRRQMLQVKKREAPEDWTEVHGKLAAYYEGLRNGQGRGNQRGANAGAVPDEAILPDMAILPDAPRQAYALEALYHRLCQAPQDEISMALNGFLAALQAEPSFARRWAQVLERAGEDAGASGLCQWGQRLAAGLSAQEGEQYPEAIDLFSALLDEPGLETGWRASALDWRGALQVLAGEYTGAARDLSDAIRLAPETAEAWLLRGEAYRRLGHDDRAVADLSRALELEPDATWALALRGAAARRLGRYEQALADLSRALELQPYDGWALALRGETYWQIECYTQALADLDHALQLLPDYLPALASRGNTYRLMGRFPEALADLDRLLALVPGHPWALARRGETHRQMSHLQRALADLNHALELDPDDDFALASRGETNRQLGDSAAALADFGQALELAPDLAWVLARRGQTYRHLGRYAEALADLNRAVELQPGDAWVLADRGVTSLRLERYAEALTDLDRAVHLEPGHASLFTARGEACRLAGCRRQALAALDRALKLDPDHAPALRSRGQTYRQLGRYPDALADLDRALELDPDSAFALRGRGETYRRLGRFEEALADLDRALELDPASAWALARRGQTYQQMERYAEALADLDRALELNPGDVWTLHNRARTHQALERMDEARADLAALLERAQQATEDRPQHWHHPFNRVVFRLAPVEGSDPD